MARKKITTVTEEEVNEPKINNEEIRTDSLEDIVAEVHGAEITREESPEESPTPEPTVEPIVDVVSEAVDLEKIRAEAKGEITDQIITALKGGTPEETSDNLNAYQKLVQDVQKEGRTPSWDEVLPLIEEAAIQKIDARNEERAEKARQDQEVQTKDLETRQSEFNKEVDEELAELDKTGKFNSKDPVQRQALFKAMAEENMSRVEWNKKNPNEQVSIIRSISRIHSNHYKAPNRQPVGADAPVGVGDGGSAVSDSNDNPYNYQEDHKKSWAQVLKEAVTGAPKS